MLISRVFPHIEIYSENGRPHPCTIHSKSGAVVKHVYRTNCFNYPCMLLVIPLSYLSFYLIVLNSWPSIIPLSKIKILRCKIHNITYPQVCRVKTATTDLYKAHGNLCACPRCMCHRDISRYVPMRFEYIPQ